MQILHVDSETHNVLSPDRQNADSTSNETMMNVRSPDRHQPWVAPGKDTDFFRQSTVTSLQFQGSRQSLHPLQPDDGPPIDPLPARNMPSAYTAYLSAGNDNPADPTLNRPRFDPENTLTGALAMVL